MCGTRSARHPARRRRGGRADGREAAGPRRCRYFASSEREFFYKIVDARITFDVDAQGRATALVLHQGGRDQRATRIDAR
jgi:hypothetical protein